MGVVARGGEVMAVGCVRGRRWERVERLGATHVAVLFEIWYGRYAVNLQS